MKNFKEQKGITLIVLIITIIVMLILAAVTIDIASGGGLFGRANEAKNGMQYQVDYEQLLEAKERAYDRNLEEVNRNKLVLALGDSWNVSEGNAPYTCISPYQNVFYVSSDGTIYEDGNIPLDTETAVIASVDYKNINNIVNAYDHAEVSLNVDIYSLIGIEGNTPDDDAKFISNFYKDQDPRFQNISTIEDLNIVVYNIYNDPDINDQASLRTALNLNSNTSDEDVFKTMLNGSSIHEYAQLIAFASYEPTQYSVKISDGSQTKDITEEIPYSILKFSMAKYTIEKNGTYELEIVIDEKTINKTIVVSGLKYLTRYVEYNNILWRVLYNDETNGLQLITADALGSVTVGGNTMEAAIESYNNAIDNFVAECKRVTGINSNIRNAGGPEVDTTTNMVTTNLQSEYSGIWFDEYNNKLKDEDENYINDINRMDAIGIACSDNEVWYWLSSRWNRNENK